MLALRIKQYEEDIFHGFMNIKNEFKDNMKIYQKEYSILSIV
jgi:hypothetical protein